MPGYGSGYNTGQMYDQAISGVGEDIANAMARYHQEHQSYDKAYQTVDALSRIGVDPQGNLRMIEQGQGSGGSGTAKLQPVLDPKFVTQYQARNRSDWAKSRGAYDALSRLAMQGIARAQASNVEDQSLSGQKVKQEIDQSNQLFPDRQAHLQAETQHLKNLANDDGKIQVPGFGNMTPAQYSAHMARQQRLDVLMQKATPMLKFETDMQNDYGLSTQDINNAAQGTFTVGKPGTYGKELQQQQGVPYVNMQGQQVDVNDALKNYNAENPTVFAKVGPNGALVPAHIWPQIAAKAKAFGTQLQGLQQQQQKITDQNNATQAQAIMATIKQKDPASLTPDDQQAMQWAQGVLGDTQ